MKAMLMRGTVSLDETDAPLELADIPEPTPGPGDVLLRVMTCGVCHTELDEIEGRAPPSRLPIILGHEVVGRVVELGRGVTQHQEGDRVGVGWIHHSIGGTDENLSPDFRATGRDANGGYAEYMTVPADYAYPIPSTFSNEHAAPLLCAGAIGYRALKLTNLVDGQRLGLTGFGGSAHLVIQLARHMFPNSDVYVFARDAEAWAFARQLGAAWSGDTSERAPQPLHAIIDTTPAWKPVVEAMKNLTPGGRLVINAIRKEDADKAYLQHLNYHEDLWMEREIKSVANITHHDIRDFLPVAAAIPIQPTIETYRLEEANRALVELKCGQIRGAKVLAIGG
ncbi:Alcohol dehydrogenase [Bremerella volcania]|uniref:alcohol dehydrogenase n=1 Tax=Bremerella volcania TaxID=2527984 RepID=A0A518C5Y4_9BACT|nr:zinc-dependent alcohol dehydrogenase family protein [Bremerella volcania]QDU74622.1 Alcohol dehydrogenase [Bremerella volcania]